MIKIYGNDGPVIMAQDGKFEIIGQIGNIITVKYADGTIGTIKVYGSNGNTIIGNEDSEQPVPPPPAPPVPFNTMRFAFSKPDTTPDHYNLNMSDWASFTKIDNYPGYSNVWDFTVVKTDTWNDVFNNTWGARLNKEIDPDVRLLEVNVPETCRNFNGLFWGASGLTRVCKFNISKDLNINLSYVFRNCPYIESGMLDFYNYIIENNISNSHGNCFSGAGTDTESGRAERAQIPSDWGGDKRN